MKVGLKLLGAAAAVLVGTCAASADIRLVHKQGNANTATGGGCGLNSNTSDTTNGPCNGIGAGYASSIANSTNNVTLVIISNGGFNENVNFNTSGRSVTIKVANNGFATLSPTSGTAALSVNLGSTDSVRIYDLWISSPNTVTNGIDFVTGGRLELHNVSIRGFGTNGILFEPGTTTSADLLVVDSDIAETSGGCVLIKPNGSTIANANIKNSQIHHCSTYGVRTDGTGSTNFVRTLISNSIVSNSGANTVISVSAPGSATARTLVENTDVLNATNGVVAAGANAQVVLNNATLVGHSTAVLTVNSGQVFSYGNDVINFNSSNGSAPTVLSLQ